MAESFQEFLQKSGQRQVTQQTQKTNPFLEEFSGVSTKERKLPFAERKGLIQTIFKPVIELGKDIGSFLDRKSIQEGKRREEDMKKQIAEQLKRTDIPDRSKQIFANIII